MSVRVVKERERERECKRKMEQRERKWECRKSGQRMRERGTETVRERREDKKWMIKNE